MFEVNPDFVIVGAKTLLDGRPGVQLIASNDVAQVKLDWNFEPPEWVNPFDLRPSPTPSHADLRAKLRTLGIVYAPDYRTAWENLMKMGDPDNPQRRPWRNDAIEPPRRALPPG